MHLTQVASGGLSSGGKESSQAVEVVRTIVPPKPTVRPSGLNARTIVRNDVGALGFPGAAALARDTWGPETIDQKWSKNYFFLYSV